MLHKQTNKIFLVARRAEILTLAIELSVHLHSPCSSPSPGGVWANWCQGFEEHMVKYLSTVAWVQPRVEAQMTCPYHETVSSCVTTDSQSGLYPASLHCTKMYPCCRLLSDYHMTHHPEMAGGMVIFCIPQWISPVLHHMSYELLVSDPSLTQHKILTHTV